uniref:Uncharacterized protein n=1 Tax=Strigamia maritima TaxID=126957 RepID=T1J4Z3_STRMM
FDAEFRRFSINPGKLSKFQEFYNLVESLHRLRDLAFTVCYTDVHGDLLPINNDDNFAKAIQSCKTIIRLLIQRKGESWGEINGYGNAHKKKNIITHVLGGGNSKFKPSISISLPEDFRQVSAIIDVDIVPETCRRVRLLKHGSDKPLGFYIRDGTSVRVTPNGLEKVPGIFISRLVPGGLAESTGLLAVNDEVLEVNGIEVAGKTLDQVTDMMVANSSNLIITVKPANQRNLPTPSRGSFGRSSQVSSGSHQSQQSLISDDDHFDQDEIRDLTGIMFDDTSASSTEDKTNNNNNTINKDISDDNIVTL